MYLVMSRFIIIVVVVVIVIIIIIKKYTIEKKNRLTIIDKTTIF
jgi:hypothetical protein